MSHQSWSSSWSRKMKPSRTDVAASWEAAEPAHLNVASIMLPPVSTRPLVHAAYLSNITSAEPVYVRQLSCSATVVQNVPYALSCILVVSAVAFKLI